MRIFTDDADRELYLSLLAEQSRLHGVEFLAWCLMTNHVHFVCVPRSEAALAGCFGEAHKRYTRRRNSREGARGWLFQGRFGSYPVQKDSHLIAVARYVEMNPVKAHLVKEPGDYDWSSARAHLDGRRRDPLGCDGNLLGLVDDWPGFLAEGMARGDAREIERRLSTGRPWGTDEFVQGLEKQLGVNLTPGVGGWPKGRKRKSGD